MGDAVNYAVLDGVEGIRSGAHEPRIGEVYMVPRYVPGKDLPMNGTTFSRAAWPKVEAGFPSPAFSASFSAGGAINNTNISSWGGKFAYCADANVLLMIHSLDNGANKIIRSNDKGDTWSPVTVAGVTDPTDLLAISKALYVGTTLYVLRSVTTTKMVVDKSVDHGQNWTRVKDFTHHRDSGFIDATRLYGHEVGTMEYRAGALYVVMQGVANGTVAVYRSLDGGATWATLQEVSRTERYYPSLHFSRGRWVLALFSGIASGVLVTSNNLTTLTHATGISATGTLYPVKFISSDSAVHGVAAFTDSVGVRIGTFTTGNFSWDTSTVYSPSGFVFERTSDEDMFIMGGFGGGNTGFSPKYIKDYYKYGDGNYWMTTDGFATLFTSVGLPAGTDAYFSGVVNSIYLGDRFIVRFGPTIHKNMITHTQNFVTPVLTVQGINMPTSNAVRGILTYAMRGA